MSQILRLRLRPCSWSSHPWIIGQPKYMSRMWSSGHALSPTGYRIMKNNDRSVLLFTKQPGPGHHQKLGGMYFEHPIDVHRFLSSRAESYITLQEQSVRSFAPSYRANGPGESIPSIPMGELCKQFVQPKSRWLTLEPNTPLFFSTIV
jgi:hypothetical protein